MQIENEHKYLYRGISEEMHRKNLGLFPKGTSFYRTMIVGQGFVVGTGIIVGKSKNNAVIGHQRDSEKFPSSGISTTPFFERAKVYAIGQEKKADGIVYKIDCALLAKKSIKQYRVKDYTEFPEFPEDDEVILVKDDNGSLPQEIVVEVIAAVSNAR